jgi:membrane-anchored protein YejM (alkaline phosphatase superfamily)
MINGRRKLLAWAGWFSLVNGVVAAIIGIRYLTSYPFPDSWLALFYVLAAHLGHFVSISWLLLNLAIVVIILVWPARRVVTGIAVVSAAVLMGLLLLDANVYAQNRFHLDGLTVALFEWSTWAMAAVLCVVALGFEVVLASSIWRWLEQASRRLRGVYMAAAMVFVWLSGQAIHVWADAVYFVPVTQFTGVLPAYYPIKAKRLLDRTGLVDPDVARSRRDVDSVRFSASSGRLSYPLEPLRCERQSAPLSVLIVLMDALRPDAIDPVGMPTASAFQSQSVDYRAHYSGGNSSRMGLFSMFYGLPSTYWQDFSKVQRAPVLIDEFQRQGYAFATFSAAGFGSPTLLDRTVFAGIPDIPVSHPGGSALEINRMVTDEWLTWIDGKQPGQPFFGFLHYDPPSGVVPTDRYPEIGSESPPGMSDTVSARFVQYRRALRWLDDEFNRVLHSLEQRGLTDRTLVVLASDHGYEFDEYGLGFIGHASNFGRYQLHSTLAMRWPGRAPASIERRTAHHSIPATLLEGVLGCDENALAYASAPGLDSVPAWDWLIAGSYNSHAVVQPDRVTVLRPGGLPSVLGPDYRAAQALKADPQVLKEAMLEMRRFYR